MDSRKDFKYSRLVADPELRRRYVSHLVDFVLQFGFDGVDLDWEFPGWEGVESDKEGRVWVGYVGGSSSSSSSYSCCCCCCCIGNEDILPVFL